MLFTQDTTFTRNPSSVNALVCISPSIMYPATESITIPLVNVAKLAFQGLHRLYTAHFAQRLLVEYRPRENDAVLFVAKRCVVSFSLSTFLHFCGGITAKKITKYRCNQSIYVTLARTARRVTHRACRTCRSFRCIIP